jgi:hypothetical protein
MDRTANLLAVAFCAFAAAPAFADGIQYTCDPGITASVCATIQTTIAGQYANVFTNANAVIYVQYGSIGGVASNTQFYNTVTYTNYYNALQGNETDANDVTAVNSLGGNATNPVVSGYGVAVTSALDAALGLAGAIGITTSNASCTIGNAGCYNDIITMSNSVNFYYDSGPYTNGFYDFYTALEHETDEALGTSSCIRGTTGTPALSAGCTNNGNGVSAADLFRYSSAGTRSFIGPGADQALGSAAYFSINSGATSIAAYNNTNNGADYGDWSTNCTFVQDAAGCVTGSGTNIRNDGGPEVAVLDAVGYSLVAPEPASAGMLALGLGFVAGFVIWRRLDDDRQDPDEL